jgi:hypothetical protein
MEVTTLSEDEVAKLREKTQPVAAKFTQEFGEASAKEMMGEIETVRGKK